MPLRFYRDHSSGSLATHIHMSCTRHLHTPIDISDITPLEHPWSLCSTVHLGNECSMKTGTYNDDGARTSGNATPGTGTRQCLCRQISQFRLIGPKSRARRPGRSKCLGRSADKRHLSAARSRAAIADLQNALPGRLFGLSTRRPPRSAATGHAPGQ